MTQVPQRPIFQKTDWYRDEDWRREVASRTCQACGAVGQSQAAHAGPKPGKSIKTHDWYVIPLCSAGPDNEGCHRKFDKNQSAFAQVHWKKTLRQVMAEAKAAWELWSSEP